MWYAIGVKMTNKFLTGLLTGITASLLICTIIVSIYTWKVGELEQGSILSNESQQQIEQNNQSDQANANATGININAISKKINLLEQYMDAYYLEEIDTEKFAENIYKGMLYTLGDPYSTYYTKEEYQSLMDSTNGAYCGIGAVVGQDRSTGIITIVKPYVNCPAYKAGMLPGDILYKVNGEEVTGEDLTTVVSKMKGEEGTTVSIEVIREGEEDALPFTLTRENIEVPTVTYEMLENQIGYIAISEFDEVTATQFSKALNDLEQKEMKGLVIDLRDNGGGVLTTAVEMLDRMLPEGMIVYTKDKNGNGDKYTATDDKSFDKPLALLINGNSASASEIFAGAIQDYKLGTLVGTTSYGKGIVQSIIPLKDGSAIKLTTSKYYTPNGRNIHGTGIEPDVVVELEEKQKKKVVIEKEDDNQLQKAIEIVREKIK